MTLKFFTIPDKRLSASILETDMSFRVSNILGWDGEALTAADFGTLHYVAFRNSANTELELMEIDPATIASGSITINKRGLEFNGDLTTEVTANKKLWVKGDTIVSFGTNPPQLYQWLKDYIDNIAIAGAPDASTTARGIVEEATQAELRARTTTGGTSARLFINPGTLPNVLTSDYVADTGTADNYAIAPSPAIAGYVTGQIFTFKAATANTTASTLAVNGLTAKAIKKVDGATALVANDIQAGQLITVQYDGTNFQMLNPVGNAPVRKFGGTGTDGVLSISSGTTTIDLANAPFVIKNYSSISITGTGKLAFSNPATGGSVVILKSIGNITLTANAPCISVSGLGSPGGAGVTSGGALSGNDGTKGQVYTLLTTAGGTASSSSASAGGKGRSVATLSLTVQTSSLFTALPEAQQYQNVFVGSGGGSGAVNNGTSQTGGRGGGALIIECGGAWNFTTTLGISVAGVTATNSTGTLASGSGGGGGGVCLVYYNTLTANTGTIDTAGGVGGNGVGGGVAGETGETGYSLVTNNTEFA